MRSIVTLLLSLASTTALASAPALEQPTQLDSAWQARTRALLEKVVEIPTVAGRQRMPEMARAIADELKAGGISPADIRIMPHEGQRGDKTVSLIARWRADKPSKRPLLILGHMDVVDAKPEDWSFDPFELREEGAYFYGRGTADMKSGIVTTTLALLKLKHEGFKTKRDIILFFTGDEETAMNGARLGSTTWRKWTDAELALNTDAGGGAYTVDGRPLGYGLETAEKTFQTYFFTARNRGGHSSRPRPDNAIYDLADALKRLQLHRFEPMLNETTRAYFTQRAKQERSSPLGRAMLRWLANPDDGEAADFIESNELEVGKTRTRCVATMLEAGHAENALPQIARATVNCRIMPGVQPKDVEEELRGVVGANVTLTPDPTFIGTPTPVSPLRNDVIKAYSEAVQRFHGPSMLIIPRMSTGATDGSFFRAAGIPVYGTSGDWIISPDDQRTHGRDERIPVRAIYDSVLHWELMLRRLAS